MSNGKSVAEEGMGSSWRDSNAFLVEVAIGKNGVRKGFVGNRMDGICGDLKHKKCLSSRADLLININLSLTVLAAKQTPPSFFSFFPPTKKYLGSGFMGEVCMIRSVGTLV